MTAYQPWKNNLEPHRNSFNDLPTHRKRQLPNLRIPELAFGFVTRSAPIEQALDIDPDRPGIIEADL